MLLVRSILAIRLFSVIKAGALTRSFQNLGHWTIKDCPVENDTKLIGCYSKASNSSYDLANLIIVPGQRFKCVIQIGCLRSTDGGDCVANETSLFPERKDTDIYFTKSAEVNKNRITREFALSERVTKRELKIKFYRLCTLGRPEHFGGLDLTVKVADQATEDSVVTCNETSPIVMKSSNTQPCYIDCMGYKAISGTTGNTVKSKPTKDILCNEAQFDINVINLRTGENLYHGDDKIGKISGLPRQDGGRLLFNIEGGTEVNATYTIEVRITGMGVDKSKRGLINGGGETNIVFINEPNLSESENSMRTLLASMLAIIAIVILVFFCMLK